MDKIGAKFKLIRQREGLSQKAFAEKLNIGPVTMNRLEKSGQQPDCQVLILLRNLFGVDLNWFLNDDAPVESTSCGIPLYNDEQLASFKDSICPDEYLQVPCSDPVDFAYRVRDEDMMPQVRPGDYVLIQNKETRHGDLCLSQTALGHIVIRKVSKLNNKVVLAGSDNSVSIHDIDETSTKIFGRISQIIRCCEV